MKPGDLVINLNSESKMTGIIVGWRTAARASAALVLWADSRCSWIMPSYITKVEAR